jgi:uncharacterized protein (DUF4415 family)
MNEKLNTTPSTWIDPDDAPELTDAFFKHADLYEGDTLIRRGRPKLSNPKEPVTIRYDSEVIAYFKATGKGWQSRMNNILKEWLNTHPLEKNT